MIHLPPPDGTKKPSTAEYTPITSAKLSVLATCTNRLDSRCARVSPSPPAAWVRIIAMPPYSGNWISTPVVLGTALATALRKLRGRQCSSRPSEMNMKL
ncbi:hypothetical protein D3C72_1636150 [compost metagenome]